MWTFVVGDCELVFASVSDTRVVGCTTGSVLTAEVDFVGSVTGLYRLIKTSMCVMHENVKTSDQVNDGFLCSNYKCNKSYFPGSIGTLVGATRGGNCSVHILENIRRMGRSRGAVLFGGLRIYFGNALRKQHVTL